MNPRVRDMGKQTGQLVQIHREDLCPLPSPCDPCDPASVIGQPSEERRRECETSLDGILAIGIPKPKSREEERELTQRFLSGLRKLLSSEDNWPFLQPLMLSLEHCAKCQTCSDVCPIYVASGKKEIYRPMYRAEVLRRLINRYVRNEGGILSKLRGNDVELNWTTIARLGELAYRCTLCRRCAQICPLGVDNGLICREIRKLFSQELAIAPRELHEQGTRRQLEMGSSTGMTPKALQNMVSFMEEEIEEKTGKRISIPLDAEGADILLLQNAGEFVSWPESTEAFAIVLDALGLRWTLSSDLAGYDAVNYGVWYDDVQLSRIAIRHAEIARDLKVKKVLIGECGHAHKALLVIGDRILVGNRNVPRESVLPLLEDAVCSGKIRLDPRRNGFPVTLHDPCNLVRMSGIVEPQRRILRRICPEFREMEPHGLENHCCGGGSGFAILNSSNFQDWRLEVAGRMKLKQILEAFEDAMDSPIGKYVCAPCSNCKGQIRDLLNHYGLWEKRNILYGGLVELIVNAMVDLKEPFIAWQWR